LWLLEFAVLVAADRGTSLHDLPAVFYGIEKDVQIYVAIMRLESLDLGFWTSFGCRRMELSLTQMRY
jgi:hypothetical protein